MGPKNGPDVGYCDRLEKVKNGSSARGEGKVIDRGHRMSIILTILWYRYARVRQTVYYYRG